MKKLKEFFKIIKLSSCLYCLAGSAVLAFGLYNIHSFSGVTEGGILGLTLLLYNCFGISPSVSGFVLNAACYIIGFRILGKEFAFYSVVAALGFSGFYAICEAFPPLFPGIAELPFLASILGAAFVGVGVGLSVRVGGAPTGDDALALSVSAKTHIGIQWVYLISDLIVLLLSLSYIPWRRLIYSLLTVVISGQIIGLFQKSAPAADPSPDKYCT